jgi:hypothetical protein
MIMKSTLSGSLVCLALLAGSRHALSYDYHTHDGEPMRCRDATLRMRAHDHGFPPGPNRDALIEAITLWNNNPSEFHFDLQFDEQEVHVGGTHSEIWFEADEYWLSGAPAVTYHDQAGSVIRWADILIDGRLVFTTSHAKRDTLAYGGDRSLQTLLLHELGHALGLGHESLEYNIMGQDWDHIHANGDTVHFYVGEDASDGAVAIYGLASPRREDVGVVHWKWNGYSGEYSSHGRTEVFDSSGRACPVRARTGNDPVYEVSRGQTVLLELVFENNGASEQTPRVRYYLSTDSTIATSDTYLASRTPTLRRNKVYKTTQRLVIPSSLTRGQTYYLGAVVDYDNAISEVNEDNNATYVGIYVR